MRGSIREKRTGYWELRVYVGLDPRTRQSRYVSRIARGGKRDAESALAKLVTEVDGGQHRPVRGSVAAYFAAWLDGRARELSPWTLRRYRSILANQIAPQVGDVQMTKLTPKDVRAMYARLLNSGLSEATVRQVRAVLRRGFEDAVLDGDRPDNPVARAGKFRITPTEIEAPPAEAVVALIARADATDPPFGTFLRLAAATGARRGELCALRWTDLAGDELRIRRSLTQDAKEKDTKTHASRRLLLDAFTIAALDAHRAEMKARAAKAELRHSPRAFMFSSAIDCLRPWSPDGVSHRFAKLRDELGFDGVRLHDLRHWSNSELLAAGLPVPLVSQRHGHRSSKMTLDVYGHARAAGDRLAADVMAGLLGGATKAPPERGQGVTR